VVEGIKALCFVQPGLHGYQGDEILAGEGFTDIEGEEPTSGAFVRFEFYVPDQRIIVWEEASGPREMIADWKDPLKTLPLECEFTIIRTSTERGQGR
jgi:hypothetical protein